jgi:hypothetical protein
MANDEIRLSFSEKFGALRILFSLRTSPAPLAQSQAMLTMRSAFIVGWTAIRHFIFPPGDSPGFARMVATMFIKTITQLSQRQIK